MASPPPATFPLLPFSNKTMHAKKAPAEAEAYIETLKELKMSGFPIAKQVDFPRRFNYLEITRAISQTLFE